MKTLKEIPKPYGAVEFEDLCKRLWREIWKDEDITKNGKSGSTQHGVDIFSPKKNYGIQCKCKDPDTNSKLTKKQIDIELIKAKKFTPALKKYYIVTSSNKDAKIQEHVRVLNFEHKKSGLFEVHVIFWDDIKEHLEDCPNVKEWYLNGKNISTNYDISISFDNNLKKIERDIHLTKIKYKCMSKDTFENPPVVKKDDNLNIKSFNIGENLERLGMKLDLFRNNIPNFSLPSSINEEEIFDINENRTKKNKSY